MPRAPPLYIQRATTRFFEGRLPLTHATRISILYAQKKPETSIKKILQIKNRDGKKGDKIEGWEPYTAQID